MTFFWEYLTTKHILIECVSKWYYLEGFYFIQGNAENVAIVTVLEYSSLTKYKDI